HTRSKRDWSSDVCSSDLVMTEHADPRDAVHEGCGRSSSFEEPGRGQVLEALRHRPPTSLGVPKLSTSSPSPRAGPRVPCSTAKGGESSPRSAAGPSCCSSPPHAL